MVVTLTEPREAGGVPGKSSLFFFTVTRFIRLSASQAIFFFAYFLLSWKGLVGGERKKRLLALWAGNRFGVPGIRLSGEGERWLV